MFDKLPDHLVSKLIGDLIPGLVLAASRNSRDGRSMGEKEYFKSMDGLRGFAAVAVLFSHIEVMFARTAGHVPRMFPGQMAVDIFFALSGFVIAYSYLGKSVDWPRFFLARFARIYPLHIVTALALLCMNLVAAYLIGDFDERITQPQEAIEELFLLSALPGFSPFVWNMPTWSISIEWWLYLTLVPCLELLTRYAPLMLTAVALMCGYSALGLFLNAHFGSTGTTRGLIAVARGVGGFTSGWICWRCWRETTLTPPGWVTDLAALAILWAWYGSFHVGTGAGWYALPLIPLLILGLSRGTGIVHHMLSTRPLRWLGTISYSVYLTHMLVLTPLQVLLRKAHLAGNITVWIACAVPMTLCLSTASYRFIERPMRDAIRGYGERRAAMNAARLKTI